MIQIQHLNALAARPLVGGDDGPAVQHDHLTGPQMHPHPAADEPGRHRVLAIADHDPGVPVDPWVQRQAPFEHLDRQRP